jgi:uncharacterized protein
MIKIIFLKAIKFYQKFISPGLPKSCRFWPSCSEYFYQAVKDRGAIKGFFKGTKRILKCFPWHPGGIDLP